MSRYNPLFLIFTYLVSLPVFAEKNSIFSGVWQGTLDSQPITVCFNAENDSGSYYYHRYLKPIHLEINQDGEVNENNEQAYWQLNHNADSRLVGIWRKPHSDKSFAIELNASPIIKNKRSDEYFEDYCGTDAFNLALEKPLTIKKSAIKYFENKPYRILSVQQGANAAQALELLGKEAHLTKANLLLAQIDGTEIFDCRRQALQGRGIDADWNGGFNEVVFWSKRWFTYSSSYSVFCADLHYNWWQESTTLDFNTGQIAHLEKWFKPQKENWQSDSPNYLPLERDSKLHRLILSYSEGYKDREADGCVEPLQFNTSYGLSLAKTGMLFTTSLGHANHNCDESVLVPYQKLHPFLSALGKKEVDAL